MKMVYGKFPASGPGLRGCQSHAAQAEAQGRVQISAHLGADVGHLALDCSQLRAQLIAALVRRSESRARLDKRFVRLLPRSLTVAQPRLELLHLGFGIRGKWG